jgi:hypothetical protein
MFHSGFSIATIPLQLGQHDAFLGLVFAFAVGVAGFADFVGLEEDDLAQAFVGVDAPEAAWCSRFPA